MIIIKLKEKWNSNFHFKEIIKKEKKILFPNNILLFLILRNIIKLFILLIKLNKSESFFYSRKCKKRANYKY